MLEVAIGNPWWEKVTAWGGFSKFSAAKFEVQEPVLSKWGFDPSEEGLAEAQQSELQRALEGVVRSF